MFFSFFEMCSFVNPHAMFILLTQWNIYYVMELSNKKNTKKMPISYYAGNHLAYYMIKIRMPASGLTRQNAKL